MPVYEYQCKACHREFEYQQRMADPDKTVCEACGGELERLISRTAFQLKGSGWYKDLYSSSKPEAKSGDGEAKGGESKPADTKPAEAKPAATPSSTSGDSGSGSTGSGSTGSGSTGSGSGSGSGTGSAKAAS